MSEISYQQIRDIVIGKLVDKTVDDDYEQLSERLFGEGNCFNSSEVRKRMYGMKTVIEAIDKEGIASIKDTNTLSEMDNKRLEIQKERQKFFDQRKAFNTLVRNRSRQEELNEILVQAVTSGSLPRLEYRRNENVFYSDSDLLVSLNDIHYGANVQNYWNTYNPEICKNMMCRYLDKIIAIAKTHNSENCIVWANGDAISGNIHHSIAVTNAENVIEQLKGVSELISEFLAELSKYFNQVVFVSVAGNHSRIEPNKDKALVDERLDDLIEWYLKARLSEFKNVIISSPLSLQSNIGTDTNVCNTAFFEKIDSTMYLLDIRGKTYCGVHGDFDATPAKVQSLQSMVKKPLYAILSGHLHHNKTDEVQGVKTIMAGSFLGMDDYCVQKRIIGRAEQMVCVCDCYGIRCQYDIPLK